ncbi:hypothetical protein SAMN05421853_12511 [Roseivivax halotolerans]|uniref:Uncharacterized protein n=1 Tax=Roseivivax halotolerans TaxID=93684 RepID=A0A1I6AM08_9RHOB|nr:hypothetical protein SAMN05421853_12511 [Roseivivax halotolerans]
MVHEGDADVDFGCLVVWVSRGDALAEGFQAAHFRFDPTSSVIAYPAFPESPAIVSGGIKVSFWTHAAGQSSFHRRTFLRIGMTGTASRPMMALWQRRV